ncbi:MAG: DNA (cytosine-5-)-methyltransferase [Rhodospirillales bacterium]|nr:DNA (cytosine-5-)-methyltransferase [Rhodospirillales bacterium]
MDIDITDKAAGTNCDARYQTRTLRCGALFAGIGGFCLGFEDAGFETAWAIELDGHAAATYRKNLPKVRLLNKNAKDCSVAGDALEPVDVLHAGFPCQSFSQAGERKGFGDPRGQLFYEIIRLLNEFGSKRPKVLVLENAPFLRYGEGGAWFLELQRAIRKAGYWFRSENCAELSADELTELPQQRTRLFMVAMSMEAFRSGRFTFPSERSQKPKNMRQYIDFDARVDDDYYLPDENRYAKMINDAVTDRECLYQLRKYVVRAKEPGVCPTLTANMGLGGHNVPFIRNGHGLRKLTEHECLRLQGFPPEFRFPDEVPRAKRYVQAGNAVTVPVAEFLARSVRDRLLEEGCE